MQKNKLILVFLFLIVADINYLINNDIKVRHCFIENYESISRDKHIIRI
jgi:hypothetical protein